VLSQEIPVGTEICEIPGLRLEILALTLALILVLILVPVSTKINFGRCMIACIKFSDVRLQIVTNLLKIVAGKIKLYKEFQ